MISKIAGTVAVSLLLGVGAGQAQINLMAHDINFRDYATGMSAATYHYGTFYSQSNYLAGKFFSN